MQRLCTPRGRQRLTSLLRTSPRSGASRSNTVALWPNPRAAHGRSVSSMHPRPPEAEGLTTRHQSAGAKSGGALRRVRRCNGLAFRGMSSVNAGTEVVTNAVLPHRASTRRPTRPSPTVVEPQPRAAQPVFGADTREQVKRAPGTSAQESGPHHAIP